jgi:hypothetical protein
MNISEVTETLRLTVKQAQEIQEEFKRLSCCHEPHIL